jgi:hypothetical protein
MDHSKSRLRLPPAIHRVWIVRPTQTTRGSRHGQFNTILSDRFVVIDGLAMRPSCFDPPLIAMISV